MGEEEKKPEEKKMEEKKPEEAKKAEEKKEEPKAEKPSEDKKEEKKAEESKEPPPPPVIVLRVYMHCEGCARKIRRRLKGVEGVDEVETDCKTHTVVVKGPKADPVKVLERVQRKSHRQVELLSPIPKPPAPEDAKKAEEKEIAKPEDKKEPPQVIIVVLKVYMHCEACSQEIKRRILRMNGVASVEPDLNSSLVTVKGVFDPPKLVEYVYKRTGKQAVIVKQEAEKKKEEKPKEEKKADDGGAKDTAKGGGEAATEKEDGGGEAAAPPPAAAAAVVVEGEQKNANVADVKKNEFYYNYPQSYQINPYPDLDPYSYPDPDPNPNLNPYPYSYSYSYLYPYPPRFELYANPPPPPPPPPPPQMFSDENPNACSVM